MDIYNLLTEIATYAIPVIFAITLHEAAHGYVAKHFGDTTAYMMGRVTLNPIRHIDPIGTVLVPILTVLLTPYMLGWAKPVPVNFNNLRHPKRDMLWVAAAGPLSNLVQMLLWALVFKATLLAPSANNFVASMAEAGIKVNIMFAILNLLPILPLDGGRILTSILPGKLSYEFSRLERYGMIILLVLLFTGALSWMLMPLYRAMLAIVATFIGVA